MAPKPKAKVNEGDSEIRNIREQLLLKTQQARQLALIDINDTLFSFLKWGHCLVVSVRARFYTPSRNLIVVETAG